VIIAAFAGTGKTFLAETQPEQFTDFVCMPYKYELSEICAESEGGKANPANVLRYEWPYNYIDALVSETQSGKHLLIPSDVIVLMMLRIKNIPYVVCYPERSAREEYRRRFVERGNTADFTDVFIGRWDRFMDDLENDDYGRHVVLKPGEYLCDVFELMKETER
jgi:hypothetical protein